MGEAAINLAFLGVSTYLVGRDVYGRLPAFTTSPVRPKRFRGEATATLPMDDVCDPAAVPSRPATSRLAPQARSAVKACCESLLERKYLEEAQSGAVPAVTAVPRVTCLNDLTQGSSANNRVGNKILIKELVIEGVYYLPSASQSDLYRLIVVIDHECYGSACTWVQYTQGAAANTINALPSMETVGRDKRFSVLVDRLLPINAPSAVAAGSPIQFHTFSLRIPLNFTAHYSGNAGTISDIVKNSLCVIEGSQAGLVLNQWTARTVFLDG